MLVPAFALCALACSRKDKAPAASPEASAADSTLVATKADSVKRADSAKRADSVNRAASSRRRDSAFGPRYEVDSNGKLRPIKKPAPRKP